MFLQERRRTLHSSTTSTRPIEGPWCHGGSWCQAGRFFFLIFVSSLALIVAGLSRTSLAHGVSPRDALQACQVRCVRLDKGKFLQVRVQQPASFLRVDTPHDTEDTLDSMGTGPERKDAEGNFAQIRITGEDVCPVGKRGAFPGDVQGCTREMSSAGPRRLMPQQP